MAKANSMTVNDHVLAFALAALFTQSRNDDANSEMLRGLLSEALPQCSRSNQIVTRLAHAAGDLLSAEPGTRFWSRARLNAETALHDWARWRLGGALEHAKSYKAGAP
ncbi:hypothetical protein [Marinovum algicola]|uniref:hypothetical protein n=1 Tax=Marinovum algicola TaxID=42444 RepID=UPI003B51B5DF